jgi:hypothetical protein
LHPAPVTRTKSMISMLNEFAEMERVSEVLAESANECFSSVPISAVLH